MRTKRLLPLLMVTAIGTTALPAAGQGTIDAGATLAFDQPALTVVDDHVFAVNRNGRPVPLPYDIVLVEPEVATQPAVSSDIVRRGPQHQ